MGGLIRFFQWAAKAICAGLCAIAFLSLFTLLYSYSGTHIVNESGATDYKWEPKQWRSGMTEGFAWLRVDENGFNNESVPLEGIDILLMGSSHMEAFNVGARENTAALLNEKLQDLVTYNIGISGHTIYRCADNLEAALEEYQPRKYVLIETSTVQLNQKEMRRVLDGKAEPIPSYNSGLLYYLQKIPAIKPIYKNLADWMSLSDKPDFGMSAKAKESADTEIPADTPDPEKEQENAETLGQFLEKIGTVCETADVTPVIFYHSPPEVNADGLRYACTDEDVERFGMLCEDNGILFVDLTKNFRELYETEKKLTHGFANTAIGEGHLNRVGHEAAASVLAELIAEREAAE